MCIVKFGAIVVDARGKLGGHNFSWNRGGNVLQSNSNNTKPSRIKSPRQQLVAINTALVKKAWAALQAPQRTQWDAAAPNFQKTTKVGAKRQSYGYEYYLKVNFLLANVGKPPLVSPAASVPLTNLGVVQVIVTAPTVIRLSVTNQVNADEVMVVTATRGMSKGRKPSLTDFNQIAFYDSLAINPISIYAPYADIFGDTIAGTAVTIGVYVLNYKTGQASPTDWIVCFPI